MKLKTMMKLYTGGKTVFPSPCGELVMKHAGDTVEDRNNGQEFLSPCGELVMKL